jgi:hypothetical protein
MEDRGEWRIKVLQTILLYLNLPAEATTRHKTLRMLNQEQATDDDINEDHDSDEEPPELLSVEEAEEEHRQFTEFIEQMRRSARQNLASTGRNAPTPAGNNNSEQPAPQTQPPPRAQPNVPLGYSVEDIHVAGTGRSFEEAFTQALARLQNRMAQPGQEGQNPQPTEAAAPA